MYRRSTLRVMVVLLCSCFFGCTSLHVVPMDNAIGAQVQGLIGKQAHLRTKSGMTQRGTLKKVSEDSVVIGNQQFPTDEVSKLQVRSFSPGKTLFLLGGYLLFVRAAFDDCTIPPIVCTDD